MCGATPSKPETVNNPPKSIYAKQKENKIKNNPANHNEKQKEIDASKNSEDYNEKQKEIENQFGSVAGSFAQSRSSRIFSNSREST